MAEFCVATGYTPEQFWELTIDEYTAMVEQLNRRNS
jgi:hypothetical protein